MIRRARTLPLLWQIFVPNAAVLIVAIALFAVTPATVSYPIGLDEMIVIALGVGALLVVNILVIRRAVGPIANLIDVMRRVDLLLPGRRVSLETRSAEMNELQVSFNRMLDRLEAERREAGRRGLLGQEEERQRLARGLHDELNQTITGIMLRLRRIAREESGGVAVELDTAQEELRALTVEVENIVNALRPETLDELGLQSALVVLMDRLAEGTDIDIERRLEEHLPPLSSDAELVIYRIAQESLTNVATHAVALQAVVTLTLDGNDAVRLTIRDDGVGMDGATEGNGIRGMRERALLVGAEFDISSTQRGTDVTLLVPSRRG